MTSLADTAPDFALRQTIRNLESNLAILTAALETERASHASTRSGLMHDLNAVRAENADLRAVLTGLVLGPAWPFMSDDTRRQIRRVLAQEVAPKVAAECPECRGSGDSSRKDRSGEYLPCDRCGGKGSA